MDRDPYWDYRISDHQEISRVLWNLKIYNCIQKTSRLPVTLNQANAVHTPIFRLKAKCFPISSEHSLPVKLTGLDTVCSVFTPVLKSFVGTPKTKTLLQRWLCPLITWLEYLATLHLLSHKAIIYPLFTRNIKCSYGKEI
jgi:hypothetical protein